MIDGEVNFIFIPNNVIPPAQSGGGFNQQRQQVFVWIFCPKSKLRRKKI